MSIRKLALLLFVPFVLPLADIAAGEANNNEIGVFTAAGAADAAPTQPEKPAPQPAEGVVTRAEFEQMKKENEELRKLILETRAKETDEKKPSSELEYLRRENKKLKQKADPTAIIDTADVKEAVGRKYMPEQNPVETKAGKLTIGGLIQVWYYSIGNDNRGWVKADTISGTPAGYSSNEAVDNDSFRIRRAQLKFDISIHDNISAHFMIDPAMEASSFPSFPSNLGSGFSGESDVHYNSGFGVVQDGTDFTATPIGNVHNAALRSGGSNSGRLLQDAYINYHGTNCDDFLSHHDISIGQFKRKLGEEGYRDDRDLDFAERSMITQPATVRDLGAQVHGTWWDNRFQYWVGVFDGAGTAFQQRYNRADDNDQKDVLLAVSGKPLYNKGNWGTLELGYSLLFGQAGKGGSRAVDVPSTTDGVNLMGTTRVMQYLYAYYTPGGPVSGWWMRGEAGQYRDRFQPGEVMTFPDVPVTAPAPFKLEGYAMSTGYMMSKSRWGECLRNGSRFDRQVLAPMEFLFRYESMQNLLYQDLTYPTRRMDVFRTTVWTAGINYYIRGMNAKIQANYNWVNEADKIDGLLDQRQAREVNNNNFVINFQLAW